MEVKMENLELVLNAVSVYQAQIDQVDKIWNYFSVVSLTVVGIILNSDKACTNNKRTTNYYWSLPHFLL